jgi:hypothetical protein
MERLARMLEAVHEDPSIHIAKEFATEAWSNLAAGDANAARRSIAAACMALRFGGHDVSSISDFPQGQRTRLLPLPLDPPPPPIPRRPE